MRPHGSFFASMFKPLDGWIGSAAFDAALFMVPSFLVANLGGDSRLAWLLFTWAMVLGGLAVLAGTRAHAEFARMRVQKVDIMAAIDRATGFASLRVTNVGGTRATFEATVEEVAGIKDPYTAGWGDRPEVSTSISPLASARLNLAFLGRHDDGQLYVCPARSARDHNDLMRAHTPRSVDERRPVRFVVDVASPDYPTETVRVVTDLGFEESGGGAAFHRLIARTHLIAGEAV